MTTSFCLDISSGYTEESRNELLEYVRLVGVNLEAELGQRGQFDGIKKLRVFTPRADRLRRALIADTPKGDDYQYEVHCSEIDARRCLTWLPDFNSPEGYEVFEIYSCEPCGYASDDGEDD